MILNLPLHPLFVHLLVVLIPLATLGVIVLLFLRSRSRQLSLAVLGVVVVAAIASIASYLSGSALADLKGFTPATHERWGLFMMIAAVLLLFVAGPWLWKVSQETDRARPTRQPLGLAAALIGVTATVFTVLAGHSGASMVWEDTSGPAEATTAPTTPAGSSATPSSTTPETSAPQAGSHTAEEVAKHNTAEDCWAIVDGNAYDLTEWVSKHPGGAGAITRLCGTDATQAFQGKHGGDQGPAEALAKYLLGPVS